METFADPPRYRPMTIKRQVNEKLVTSNGVERLTKKDKGDQDGRRNIERHAENTAGVEIKISCDPSPRRPLRIQQTGK